VERDAVVSAFFGKYGFMMPDSNSVIQALLYDMQQSLDNGRRESAMGAKQAMIPTWCNFSDKEIKKESVIVIDAGGTNFRTCLVTFDHAAQPVVSDFRKMSMPGIQKELSKEEFFDTIAHQLDYLKNKSKKIGFCFSYAMEITPDRDGKVLGFSKEIKASAVIGSQVGASLKAALKKTGWEDGLSVTLLNDTTAALLAGKGQPTPGVRFSSYIGFILGTGLNIAYIESGPIRKIDGIKDSFGNAAPASQIVVCESCMFDKIPLSEFDRILDDNSCAPGEFTLEKMCSGAYIGPLAVIAVRQACTDCLFSAEFAAAFKISGDFVLADMDRFLYTPFDTTSKLGKLAAAGKPRDYEILYQIFDSIIERAAVLSSAVIAAAVIKSGQGFDGCSPVCILCNGTTFSRTHNLRRYIETYLTRMLESSRGLHFVLKTMENDITIGTALAALT
jgi:hexokinase